MSSKQDMMKVRLRFMTFVALVLMAAVALAQVPLDTSFTLQGIVEIKNRRLNGTADFIFEAYSDPAMGAASFLGSVTHLGVEVDRGLFMVDVNFIPNVFTGDTVWIKTSVREEGDAQFTELLPPQQVTAAPYAVYALNAGSTSETDHAADADLLDGLDSSAFLRTTGGSVSGSLAVTGGVSASSFTLGGSTITNWSEIFGGDNLGNHTASSNLQMGSHDVYFNLGFGLRTNEGAQLKTGPLGQTFQFWPGGATAHSVIFRDANGVQKVVVDSQGRLGVGTFTPDRPLSVTGNAGVTGNLNTGSLSTNTLTVGGVCFRPRTLVRCWVPINTAHLVWVDNRQECINANGVVEHEVSILAGC